MTKLDPATTLRAALALAIVSSVTALCPGMARANQAPPPPSVPVEATPVAAPVPPAEEVPPGLAAPGMARPPARAAKPTDHDSVVGHWGVEARQLASLQRTPGQDQGCAANCPVTLNAFGVRRWYEPTRAWSAGLAFGIGGGSSRVGGQNLTWDTYLAVGPTVGMSFLLANWKHLAVSASPQLDLLFFMPGGSRSKTFMANARGLIEGELHLGMIGLPAASVGLSSGVALGFKTISKADGATNPTNTATEWSFGPTAPQSLWGLVTNMYLRFYL